MVSIRDVYSYLGTQQLLEWYELFVASSAVFCVMLLNESSHFTSKSYVLKYEDIGCVCGIKHAAS